MSDTIRRRVHRCISDTFGISEKAITDKKDFAKDFEIDELDSLELVMCLEEEFGISIGYNVADKINSSDYKVGDLVNYIISRADE